MASTIIQAGLGLLQGTLWNALQGAIQGDSKWGIFDKNGKRLGDPAIYTGVGGLILDSMGIGSTLSTDSLECSKDARISYFPVERGSFASYNKVEQPPTCVVALAMQGSEKNRTTFLQALNKAISSTDLYNVAMPEGSLLSYSVERYNFSRRSSKGTTLLIVEVSLKKVREVTALYSQNGKVVAPKKPEAAAAVDTGKLQDKVPGMSTLKAIANKISGLADTAKEIMILPSTIQNEAIAAAKSTAVSTVNGMM